MKRVLLILTFTGLAHAEPMVTTRDWVPACDGSNIEVISEAGTTLSVTATAYHSGIIAQWSIHFIAGRPATAEYRSYRRERIRHGDRAGDYSGQNTIQRVSTWKAEEGVFSLPDAKLGAELNGILNAIKEKSNKARQQRRRGMAYSDITSVTRRGCA